ncbi:hypothetical protein D9M69_335490 [compost metagenome]
MQLVEQRLELVVADQLAAGRHALRRRGHGLGRRGGDRFRGELALAMQLVEQRFELVVADLVAASGGRGGLRHRHHGGRRVGSAGIELALAVQLVEQRLELVVADLVVRAAGFRGGRGGLVIESGEQLLEFAVGDVALGRCNHRLRLGDRRGDRLVVALRLGQARQRGQQLGRGGRQVAALAHFGEHAVDRVQRGEDHIHQLGVDLALTLAQDVEDVLGDVAALHQFVQLQEARPALDGVETAKDRIEQVGIVRPAFQLDQLLGQLLENLAGLYQEVLEDFFIGAEAHSCAP